jgi:phenylacetate-CoA ligase
VALLCALPHGVEYAVDPPALHGGRLSRLSLARPEPLRRLLAFDPHVLFTDPAGLHWLVAQEKRPRPRITLSSGQHLPAELRDGAAARLGSPVVNYYSTTETGPLAWECLPRPGRFHVLHPDVWIESTEGELVVTRLRASVLPLLRYRTGDGGAVETERCPCGYRGRSIVGLQGRRACYFETPEGRRVDAWQLAWLFKHEPLSGFRLTQVGESEFRLELLAGNDVKALRQRLQAALGLLGWPSPRIDLPGGDRLWLERAKPEPFRCAWTR